MTLKRLISSLVICSIVVGPASAWAQNGKTDNASDWFYPAWAAEALHNDPIVVRDTDSALGRYNRKTKQLGLKDLARAHGHLCDGLVISFVLIKAAFTQLFPDGIVDRTDLVAVSKNGPCWVDTVALMTGARINFKTLRIDNSVGNGFIIQRISTGKAFSVHLKDGVFPAELIAVERTIRQARAQGKMVTAHDIDIVERMHGDLIKKLLTTPPEQLVDIKSLQDYRFTFSDLYGERGDVINKNMPRE